MCNIVTANKAHYLRLFLVAMIILAFLLSLRPIPASADMAVNSINTGAGPYAVAVNPATNKIYVANSNSDDVTVIDGATNTSTNIPAGSYPYAVAVNPATNKIYVANSNSDDVTVIDGATNTSTNIPAGSYPKAVAVNPATNKIYVVNTGSNNVTVIDGATNTSINIPAGTCPFAVAVNPVTNKIYVANIVSHNVTVIDGATNTTAIVASIANPCAVAVNPATNKIYVANYNSARVTVINGATDTISTTVNTGTTPHAVTVNIATNKIYVANHGSNNVTVINGATDTFSTTVNTGTTPYIAAVNPATNKIYVANYLSDNVTVINGATDTFSATVNTGTSPNAVAVNPATNKIYVINFNSSNVTVIDGATNTPTTITAGAAPNAVAVNPATNKTYVTNSNSDNVTVIDGATNTTTTVPAGSFPTAIAVNPATNKIYVTNLSSDNVTVIDGATNTTATVDTGESPKAVAVNPATNKIYVANSSSNNVTVIDGDTNATTTVTTGTTPCAVAVNPTTNKIYVANSSSGNVTVIDGATNSTSAVITGAVPQAVAVNPVTNKIYVTYLGNSVIVIDGATDTFAGIVFTAGSNLRAVAVNPVTNKIYVVNYDSNIVTVIDGATNTTTTIAAGSSPYAVAVNPATNKIYTANCSSDNVTVIDGATNTTTTITTGSQPCAVAVNPATNKVYAASLYSGNVTVIEEQPTQNIDPAVTISPLPNDTTTNQTPSFHFNASSGGPLPVQQIWYQTDTLTGEWLRALPTGGSADAILSTLSPDTHILYAMATDGLDATSINTGFSGCIVTGKIAAYVFTIVQPATATASAASLTPVAGANNTITFTVKDGSGSTDTTFNGSKNVEVSGYTAAPDGSSGSFNGTSLTTAPNTVPINFTNGVATPDLALNNSAAQTIGFSVEGVATPATNTINITPQAGTAASMTLTQDIQAPPVNGAQFAQQPVVTLKDNYENICANDSATEVTASKKDAGSWTLTGTLTVTANLGVATFTDLGANNLAAVTGAQLAFDSTGLTQITSSEVNLPGLITLTSPNGGEAWIAGTTHIIRWNYTGNPGLFVKIELLKNGNLNRILTRKTSTGNNGAGVYEWEIAEDQALGNDYTIRVTDTDNGHTDTSDTPFTIASPITLTVPNNGEVWTAGTTQVIRWNYTGKLGQYVKIELLKNGNVDCVLANRTQIGKSGAGDYRWRISEDQDAGNDYTIRVTCTGKIGHTDTSDIPFTITNTK